jgi:phosphohistidine phosphatase
VQLLVVRHAIAAPRETFDGPDAARALTDEGRARMERGARALRRLVPELDHIAPSPLVRAVETAEILAGVYGGIEAVEVACLLPGANVGELAAWLEDAAVEALAIVGHEPDLSIAVSWLAAGVEDSRVVLGKGGAALLDLPGEIGAGQGSLLWLLRPAQLRRLA